MQKLARPVGPDMRPEWADALEELFEQRFRFHSVEELLPTVEIEPGPFALSVGGRQHEAAAQRLAGKVDDPVAVSGTVEGPSLRRNRDNRLIICCRVARWSQLVAMRSARDPAFGLYAGGIAINGNNQFLISHRSAHVRFYPGHLASFGGSFVPRNPAPPSDVLYDVDLSAACSRELSEETGGVGIDVPSTQKIIILLEQDRTEIGDQHSIHVVFTQARVSHLLLDTGLRSGLDEGTVCALPALGSAHLNELAAWFLGDHGPWAPCGLAHYLIWLRLGAPGLPNDCAPLALDLFDGVVERMLARGSWQHPKWLDR